VSSTFVGRNVPLTALSWDVAVEPMAHVSSGW
jgi:hypothetical protein